MSLMRGGALAIWLFVGQVQPTFAETAAQPPQGVKRALLIGINRYKSVPTLKGSVNDVETMREILTTRWGFSLRNIAVLTDENATRDKIIAALEQLVQKSGPADTVYFHYAGHGSQVPDVNGDESDGLDESIVPQDGRGSDIRDIIDDELDAIFSQLHARSAVIVLDSCHSGTATRALDFRARSLPQDTRIELYRTNAAGTTTRGIVPFERSGFVVMTGAAANESALDGSIDGRFHGFFTYALSRTLIAAPSDVSPRSILSGVTRELARIQAIYGRASMPEPQLEAPIEALDKPLFVQSMASDAAAVSAEIPRLSWLNVLPTTGEQVTLVDGLLLGAVPGSTWAIYPDGETQFVPGQAVAVALVMQLTGKDALARLTQRRGPITPESRAVALMPAPASVSTAIRFLNVPEDQRSRLEDFLRRSIESFTPVGPERPARFLIDTEGEKFRLLTADGLQVVAIFDTNDDRSVADVARIVSRTSNVTELLALDNPSSQLVITAHAASELPLATRDIKLVAETGPAKFRVRNPGEMRNPQNSLQLSITVNVAAYLTVAVIDSESDIQVSFPNDWQRSEFYPDGAIPAGRQILIPDSLEPKNSAGFYWDFEPPSGLDTIRVFASTDLATANLIRRRIRALQSSIPRDNPRLQSRAIEVDLENLRSELATLATRGSTVVADRTANLPHAPADWAATSITIQVDD